MKVRDVMTHSVVTVAPETPIREAIARMIGHRISGMPVVDEDVGLVGILTEGDLMRRTETGTQAPRRRWLELLTGPGSCADEYARTHGRLVRDVMTAKVVSVGEDAPLADVVRLMEENAIKRIPVVAGKRLVGIVSRADLVSALGEQLAAQPKSQATDDAIRRRIVSEMKRQPWCPSHGISVSVRGGAVRLEGIIFDERERHALHVLVERIHGVQMIDDQLACVEPLSGTVIEEPHANPVRVIG